MQKLIIFLIVTALLAIAVTPALGDEDKNPAPDKTQDQALKIYERYGCRECHAISALKIGLDLTVIGDDDDDDWDDEEDDVSSPDLSNVGLARDAKWISMWLRKKVDNDGVKHKKRFQGSKEERQALSLWLESLKHELPEGVGVDVPAATEEKVEP